MIYADWNTVTVEEALAPGANPLTVYGAEKTLAEKFAWKFADEHPEVEITTCPYTNDFVMLSYIDTCPF